MNRAFRSPECGSWVNVAYRNHEEFQKLVELNYKENEAMILELGLHKSQKNKE